MPKISVNQTNFTAGEISPRMKGRTDVARYQSGAEIIENGVPVVHGGVDRRDGFGYCATAKYAGARKARMIPYIFNVEQAFAIEFGHGYARIFDANGARVLNAALAPIELVHPYTEAQIFQLTHAQGGDTLLLFHPDVRPHKLRRVTALIWEILPVHFVVEPFGEIGVRPFAPLTISSAGLGSKTFTSGTVTAPGAPTAPVATPLNAAANIAFTAPASNGGSEVSLYTVTSSPGGFVGTGTVSPIRVAGLSNGTAYTFTVTATNSAGTSAPSVATAAVTPLATLASIIISVTVDKFDKYFDGVNGTVFDIEGPTAIGSAGIGPYTYSWALLPGASPAVKLTRSNTPSPLLESTGRFTTNVAALRCTATDSTGGTATVDVNMTINHSVYDDGTGEQTPGFGDETGTPGWKEVIP